MVGMLTSNSRARFEVCSSAGCPHSTSSMPRSPRHVRIGILEFFYHQTKTTQNVFILKPILFYLFILFDGSGDINFSFCFALTLFSAYFLFLPSTLLQRRASRFLQASSIIALPATCKAHCVLLLLFFCCFPSTPIEPGMSNLSFSNTATPRKQEIDNRFVM